MSGIQDAALKAVNDYFERALRSVPEIDAYLQEIVKQGAVASVAPGRRRCAEDVAGADRSGRRIAGDKRDKRQISGLR